MTPKLDRIWTVEVSCEAMAENNAYFIESAPKDVSDITPFSREKRFSR